jgi:NTP pyrophosphatase (non-canonical NTP hydrolase)
MKFSEIQKRALEIHNKYSKLEQKNGRAWTRQDIVRGFVGDVGDLVKLTMAEDGIRDIDDSKNKLRHELADCLWSIIVIARQYEIDLEDSFLKTMDELEKKIDILKNTL